MVPGGGIEPPQGFWPLRILSPLRLPISPSRRVTILAEESGCPDMARLTSCYAQPTSGWMPRDF
jgi:hypothetical protein